jgi:uncharacterized membrane protein
MDPTVFQYELPYLHPVVVHAPIALLIGAAGAAAAYAFAGTRTWRLTTLALLIAGSVGAWLAHETGETLEDAVEGEPHVEALIETHEGAAEWTQRAALLAALSFAAASLWWRARPASGGEPLAARLLLLLPALAAALLVAYTAHVGGLMVWGVPR